jgi:hypothetical protein
LVRKIGQIFENLKKHLILALLTFNSLIFGCILPEIVKKKEGWKRQAQKGVILRITFKNSLFPVCRSLEK